MLGVFPSPHNLVHNVGGIGGVEVGDGGGRKRERTGLFVSFRNSGNQTMHFPHAHPEVTSFLKKLAEVTSFLRYLMK
jgi:hypothetical protein